MSTSTSEEPRPTASVRSLDHLVLTVASIPATVAWYKQHLGMTASSFRSKDTERQALLFGAQKINLHQAGREFEPKAQQPLPGSADLCFLTADPVDQVRENFIAAGIEVLEDAKVVDRTGAKSKLRSVYVRDPDGNLVE